VASHNRSFAFPPAGAYLYLRLLHPVGLRTPGGGFSTFKIIQTDLRGKGGRAATSFFVDPNQDDLRLIVRIE